MSTPTSIDSTAPVVSRHRRLIDAAPARLWDIHTAVNSWPTWQSDIASAQLDGPFEEGESFAWSTTGGFAVTSTIYSVGPGRRVLWGGTADGITGIHEWDFRLDGDRTLVLTNESWSAESLPGEPAEVRKMLSDSLESWLDHLQQEAEK